MPSLVMIVPCYNEGARLPEDRFIRFGQAHAGIRFLFVNDGSTDNTATVLARIAEAVPGSEVMHLKKNSGKGEAVRQGLLKACASGAGWTGYLDADLSTGLEEFQALWQRALDQDLDGVLGARIKKLDTVIERSYARHLVGRIIATLIDQRFRLGVYDTQCGAKVFRTSVLCPVVGEPFHSRWFFDVELLLRLQRGQLPFRAEEVALKSWVNVRNSKLSALSFAPVLRDLYALFTKY